MSEHSTFCSDSVDFIRTLFHVYLVERDFDRFIGMLDPDVSWFGTGAHEICHHYAEALGLLQAERDSWDGHFRIERQWYQAAPLREPFCMVYGELYLTEVGGDVLPMQLSTRFTMLCHHQGGEIKLFHSHFSVPSASQNEDEFVDKSAVNAYNLMLKEALRVSEKRYEVAMQLCDATMFEYDVLTGSLILPSQAADAYSVPKVVKDGVETFVKNGIIEPESELEFRELYRKIHEGEPFAQTIVHTRESDGAMNEYELSLTNMFDETGRPVRAIGVRRNVTELRRLEKEKNYGETLVSNKYFVFEANITRDEVLHMDQSWNGEFAAVVGMPYSEMIAGSCNHTIDPAYRELVRTQLYREQIEAAYESGQRLISFVYRKKTGGEAFRWFEATVNIIRDSSTGDINIRYYTMDINDQKEKEQKAKEERRLYENMLTKALMVYEVNITTDAAVSGHENWESLFGIHKTGNYSQMIAALCERAIHPEDRDAVGHLFLRENVVASFHRGERELTAEYRRPDDNGEFIWVRCALHLYEDLSTGDIRGYAYVEDIDAQKKEQLLLIYQSEHDQLTGLYNKAASEKLIEDYLRTSDGRAGRHAYLMIDVDHFKAINDHFGHAFGDAVLSQIAGKIRDLFREDDVVGRVGGDEFVVLMKNTAAKPAMLKASELCAQLAEVYTKETTQYSISASIGIALYGEHGKNYQELYRHSDSALYFSKRNGRNRYCVYTDNMEAIAGETKGIDARPLLEVRSFEENVSEYVLRILYESQDREAAVNAILSLMGRRFQCSRMCVFENSRDGRTITNTFEWCNRDIESHLERLQNIPYSDADAYRENFDENGIFYTPDVNQLSGNMKIMMKARGVKSLVQFAILRRNQFAGFISFEECRYYRVPSRSELTEMNNTANLLSVFITEMRAIGESESIRGMVLSIVNGLDSYAYVCDPQTYRVLFINEQTRQIAPGALVGDFCYEAFWNRREPCESCPMRCLKEHGGNRYSMELYNTNLDIFIKATASWIDWMGGQRVCLVDSVDITQYKGRTRML